MSEIPVLISVHFPKSGGTSIGRAFAEAFGQSCLLSDYGDDPADPASRQLLHPEWYMAHRPKSISPFKVVHGHFPIVKYDLLSAALRVVLLREPVENLISIYYYWKHLAQNDSHGHEIFNFFKAERLTLLETAAIPALRRLMSHTYFGGFNMARFDVIGDFARRTEYFEAVFRRTGVRLNPDLKDNETPFSVEREEMMADSQVTRYLRDLLIEDVRFYERYAGRGV